MASLRTFWFRATLAASFLLLMQCLAYLLIKIDGWFFHLTPWQVLVSVSHHALLALAEALVLGALATLAVAGLTCFASADRREPLLASLLRAIQVAAGLVFFLLMLALGLRWAQAVKLPAPSHLTQAFMAVALCIAFAVLLVWRRTWVLTRLENLSGSASTRRAVVATGLAALGVAVLNAALAPALPVAPLPQKRKGSAPNILLITFDALSAQDMSLYGYRLATTPNIDAFARQATVFDNYYSGSTFTSPSVTTMMTGCYPSTTKVYHLQGALHGEARGRTLFAELARAGYEMAASVTNPYAHPHRLGMDGDFVRTAPPPMLHNFLSGPINNRSDDPLLFEYPWSQESLIARQEELFRAAVPSEWPPHLSFQQGEALLETLDTEGPWFLWVHAFAPHAPYLPAAPWSGRFSKGGRPQQDPSEESSAPGLFGRQYTPAEQEGVDRGRLSYDDFIAECDQAFADFMGRLEAKGKLKETAVILSADHGESFQGGVLSHGNGYQTLPVIHVPLVIRLPGQTAGHRVAMATDQTALAPTILDIAGVTRPFWMEGRSLLPQLRGGLDGPGFAFTQYLETNSIFAPVTRGSLGVVDGHDQYVMDLASGRGLLRPLTEAASVSADHSAENPRLAALMRQVLRSRFPNLPIHA